MSFNAKECLIPTVYCGKQERKYPYEEKDNLYVRQGTPGECLRKGFGAATARENKKHLAASNLQNIRYVGPAFEKSFQENGIHTTDQLLSFVRRSSAAQIKTKLTAIFQTKKGALYGKGYNSVLLWLYQHGNSRLPKCTQIALE